MTPEQAAAATADTQIVNPPTDDHWEKFKQAAIYLQGCGTDTDLVVEVRRLQKANPWLLGMLAWHGIVMQEIQLRDLAIRSRAEEAATR